MSDILPLTDAQRGLVVEHIRLPVKVVHQSFWAWLSEYGDDLISTGNVALCVAAAMFDESKHCSFRIWALRGIRDAVRDEVRRIIRRRRIPEERRDGSEWRREQGRAENVEHVRARLPVIAELLTPKEWGVVDAVCGFTGEPMTRLELATASGVSKQAVSKTMKRAVSKSAEVLQ